MNSCGKILCEGRSLRMSRALANQLSLAPWGAGDLIDRAVRLYRRHFITLIRIAAPPVLVSALGWTTATIAFSAISVTSSSGLLLLYVLMLLGSGVIVICGSLFSIIVMGGATRNLVAHLLWNEPVSFRTTYRAVKARFWGLLGASLMVALWLGFSAWLGFMTFWILAVILWAALALASIFPWLTGILGGIG